MTAPTIRRATHKGWQLGAFKIGESRTFPCAKADRWLVQHRLTAAAAYQRRAQGMTFKTTRTPQGVEVMRLA